MSELDRVWDMRDGGSPSRDQYNAAARRLGKIDALWSRTATSCREENPCYGCCLRALRALEAALS